MNPLDPARTAVTTALAEHQVVALRGPDAVAFAQAQLANDVAALADGQWQWNCLLTAPGRVVALMPLLRFSPGELLLVVPHSRAAEIATRLRPYVLRRKLEVAPDPAGAWWASWVACPRAAPSPAAAPSRNAAASIGSGSAASRAAY